MALKWFLSSSFTQMLGLSSHISMQHGDLLICPFEGHNVQECVKKSLKNEAKEGLSQIEEVSKELDYPNGFQMPLHYPRYTKGDYEKMEEWKLDMLLKEYGLRAEGTLDEKRDFAVGAFLWS